MRLELSPTYPIPQNAAADNPAIQGPLFEIQSGPTDYAIINGIVFHWNPRASANPTLTMGVGVPAARGVGINGIAFLNGDGGNNNSNSGLRIYSQWNTLPTVPTNFMRRLSISFSNGHWATIPFRFSKGIKMQPSTSLVFWSIAASAAFSVPVLLSLELTGDG